MKKILIFHNQYIEKAEDIAVERELNLLKERYVVEEIILNNKNTGSRNNHYFFNKFEL